MFAERVQEQCNGGNVWGYTNPSDVGATTFTNGMIDVGVRNGRHTIKFVMRDAEGWEITY